MNKVQRKIDSKIGPLYLIASKGALHGIFWDSQKIATDKAGSEEAAMLDKVERQLSEYFDGKRKTFDLVLDMEGTEFQKRVWAALKKIPYGETRSYKDIATSIKNPKAYRAVGTANGSNPISLIVPCHRVIAADGTIGGYGGGLSIKEKLLMLEQTGKLK